MLWIIIGCIVILIGAFVIMEIRENVLWTLLFFLILPIFFVPTMVAQNSMKFNYSAYAIEQDVYQKLYFDRFVQEGNCVILEEPYTFNQWELAYKLEGREIIIKVPEGQEFEYRRLVTPQQEVVNSCGD